MGFVIASIIAGAASATGKGVGAGLRAKAAREAAQRQARMLRYEANDKDVLAFRTRVRGAAMAGMKASEIEPLRGTVRSNVAASGVDVDSGSAQAMETQATRYKMMDSMAIRFNAEQHAQDLDRTSGRLRLQARQTVEQGDAVARAHAIAGAVGATTSLVETGIQTFLAANRPTGDTPDRTATGTDPSQKSPPPTASSERGESDNWWDVFDPIVDFFS
jgi:hypothetical protein